MLTRTHRTPARALVGVLFVLLAAPSASAQFKAGVQGTVSDPQGAVVAGATVTLTSNETNRSQQTTSSDDGFYRFSSLPPGRYTITAEGAGFKKTTLENVTVNAEDIQGVDVVMTTGEITESVTVTSEAATGLETENANVSRAITTEEIQRLPQFARDPYELIRLTPGVFGSGARSGGGQSVGLPNSTGPGGSNNSIFQVENQPQVTANGQRISANNFQVDGVSVNSLQFGGAAVVTPNQESVKEMRVKSSTYSAEDGRNSGAQVQVVSQNGTNDFHGSLFLKYNGPNLNACNKYGPGFGGATPPCTTGERVERLFRQFGGSIGGPLPLPRFGEGGPSTVGGRDRSFFFFSYEGLRESSAGSSVRFVETPEFRQQIINARPNSIVARILGSPGIAPRIAGIVPTTCAQANLPTGFFPNCQVVGGGLDIGSPAGAPGQYLNFGSAIAGGGLDGIPDIQRALITTPRSVRANQYNLRFDFTPTSRDQIAFSTYVTKNNILSAEEGSAARASSDIRTKPTNLYGLLTYVRTLSNSTVNEVRFSATRFEFDELVSSSDTTDFGIPRIEIEGLPFDRIRFGAPWGETTPGVFAQNTFELRDVLTHVRGNHALKFGGELRWEQDNNNLLGGARPLFTFVGPFNFANDAPIFYQINADPRTGGPAEAQRYFRTTNYAFFVQDDWKARPNLTLNLGLRYEYFTPLREKRGQLSNIVFGSQGLADARVAVVGEEGLFEPDRNNFAPRLGFAWSPARFDSKLVVRGGFGISYNRLPNVLFANTRGNPPFFARYQICCGTPDSPFAGGQILYALGASNSPTSYPFNPALAVGIDPATGAPAGRSVEIYGAEPEVPNAYVYAYSFEGQYELPGNMVAELGYQGSAGHKLIRLVNQNFIYPNNPAFFAVFVPQPDVNSNYNALNARLTRRLSRGVQFDAYYRWAKSIDQLSNEGPGAETNQTFPQDNRTERGPSDFDVKHYFNLSGLWELPIFRNRTDLAGKVLGGWQLNGILTYHTGFPWTPKTGSCVSTPGGPTLCPARPVRYFGGVSEDTSDEAFTRPGGIFPGGGLQYFDINNPGGTRPPGIGRNSFRGPKYFNIDLTAGKRFGLPRFAGEGAFFEVKANFYNVFNMLNLQPFRFDRPSNPRIEDANFGRSERGLAGRVVELQARFSF